MTIYKITNDEYSNEEVIGTIEELQADLDELGWSVTLEAGATSDGTLYDVSKVPAVVVGEPVE